MVFRTGLLLLAMVLLTHCAHAPRVARHEPIKDSGYDAPSADGHELRDTVAEQSEEIDRLRRSIRKLEHRGAEKVELDRSSVPVVVLTPDEELEDFEEGDSMTVGDTASRVDVRDIDETDLARDGEAEENGDESGGDRRVKPRLRDGWRTVADSRHDAMPLYFRGLQMYRARNFDGALDAFTKFVQAQPSHVYSDRAQFWLGESFFANGEYPMALKATHLLENRYPFSFRLPDALHRRALCLLQMGQTQRAADTWRDLLRRFPGEPAAQVASRELGNLLGSPR